MIGRLARGETLANVGIVKIFQTAAGG